MDVFGMLLYSIAISNSPTSTAPIFKSFGMPASPTLRITTSAAVLPHLFRCIQQRTHAVLFLLRRPAGSFRALFPVLLDAIAAGVVHTRLELGLRVVLSQDQKFLCALIFHNRRPTLLFYSSVGIIIWTREFQRKAKPATKDNLSHQEDVRENLIDGKTATVSLRATSAITVWHSKLPQF